jgi:hypothetical protein
MIDIIGLAIQTLISNPLTVSLVILGTFCVALAIIGKIPPMQIEGARAIILAVFGFGLIFISIGLAWTLTVSVSPTVAVPPLARTPAIPATGCNGWCMEIGQMPEIGSRITQDLTAGQLMVLSGGQLLINGKYCGDDAQQICILLYEASEPLTVVVDSVIAKNNYIGITDTYDSEQVLNIKTPAFWKAPNCTNGCKKATVFFFRDGKFVRQETITP